MGFDLGDYVEVKDRIAAFRKDYPDGRLTSEIVDAGFPGFVTVKAYAYRTPDDPVPGTGLAWEPVPGKTPYTKDSELQNAETSAWGRAIVAALISDASKGVASADEVRNRQAGREGTGGDTPGRPSSPCPQCGSDIWDNFEENNEREARGQKRRPDLKCKKCDWIQWNLAEPVKEEFEQVELPPEAYENNDPSRPF